MASSQFAYVTYIRTTPEKLWQALIDPEFTRRYWCETFQESEWKPGASWRNMIPDGRVGDSGEILEIDPHRRLVLTWQNQFILEMREEGHSRLTYELEQVGQSVKLTLIHEIDKPESKLIEAVSSGWPHILSSLKSLLETGESLEETRRWPGELSQPSPSSADVRVTRRFSVPAERVFDAWLDAQLIGQWMFGPALRDEEILRIDINAHVGGSFSFLVRRGGNEIDHVGRYRQIDRPRRLIFSWGIVGDSEDESVVTIDIVPLETGCELRVNHEMAPKWAEYAARTEAGWTKMLEALGRLLSL